MIHELKTWPEFFEAVKEGDKTFEIRKNDRPFGLLDSVVLREWCPECLRYTGRVLCRDISYILPVNSDFGVKSGYCLFGLVNPDDE